MSNFEGLDAELGITEEKVTEISEVRPKRRFFHIWTVRGEDYKLKLNVHMIGELEKKYRTNILNLVSDDGLPPLSTMLTIIQAAAAPWNHKISYEKIKKMYEFWCDDGGNQIDLLSKVVMPVLVVSGFFTEEQGNAIMAELENSKEFL